MNTSVLGDSSLISMARLVDTVQQILEHHSRPIWRSREPTHSRMHTRSGTRPSDGQYTLPPPIICSTWVVVTTSSKVPKPHSGLLIESKWVKPVPSTMAPACTFWPFDSVTAKLPISPSTLVTRVERCTVIAESSSTCFTMRPMASLAHSPEGTSLAYPDRMGAPPSRSSFSTSTTRLPAVAAP